MIIIVPITPETEPMGLFLVEDKRHYRGWESCFIYGEPSCGGYIYRGHNPSEELEKLLGQYPIIVLYDQQDLIPLSDFSVVWYERGLRHSLLVDSFFAKYYKKTGEEVKDYLDLFS